MLAPPRISPLPASARSCCAAARPLPRSSSVKHLDWDTNTLMSASGDSRLYASHHLFSGSVTASVPILLSQVGICDKRIGDRKSTRLNSSHGYISYAVL